MYAILIRYTVSNFHHTMMRYNANFYKNEPPLMHLTIFHLNITILLKMNMKFKIFSFICEILMYINDTNRKDYDISWKYQKKDTLNVINYIFLYIILSNLCCIIWQYFFKVLFSLKYVLIIHFVNIVITILNTINTHDYAICCHWINNVYTYFRHKQNRLRTKRCQLLHCI